MTRGWGGPQGDKQTNRIRAQGRGNGTQRSAIKCVCVFELKNIVFKFFRYDERDYFVCVVYTHNDMTCLFLSV